MNLGCPDLLARQHWPNLRPNENYTVTSDSDSDYNCAAFAANDTENWWQPSGRRGAFWPSDIRRDMSLNAYQEAYSTLQYAPCADGSLEQGFEKIALYANSQGIFEHAARQLPSGRWTSKLGDLEDITHDTPEDVAGNLYGEVVLFMRRRLADQEATSA